MNKYLKVWLKSGSYFGISMGLFYTFQQNNYISGAISGVATGIIFGGAMAGVTYFSDKKMKKRGFENSSTSVNHTLSLEILLPIKSVESVIQEAILSIPKAKIKSTSNKVFEAKTGMTWKSFGEDILITLEEKELVVSEAKEILDVENVIASIILVEDLRIQKE